MLLSNDRVRPPYRPEVRHRDNRPQEATQARAGQRCWTGRNRGPASSSPQQSSKEPDRVLVGAGAALPLREGRQAAAFQQLAAITAGRAGGRWGRCSNMTERYPLRPITPEEF